MKILNLTRDIRSLTDEARGNIANMISEPGGPNRWFKNVSTDKRPVFIFISYLLNIRAVYRIRYIICRAGTLYAKQELTARLVSNFEN